MKRTQMFICALMLVTFAGCKTQEDIRREQTVQNLNSEIQETKKTAASGNSRFQAIEEQLQRMTGQVEEANHNRAQSLKENQQLAERITALEEANKKSVEYLKALTEKVNNQSGYIEEVIASLAKLSEKPASSSSKSRRSSGDFR
jgi:septal ring factor EnvC (AmiA/AmiB activator)